jgi:PEGA domain
MIQKLAVGLIASAVTLSLSPAWAGQRERPAGAETVGSAAPRDSGGGGSSSGAASSGSSSGSTSSGGGSTWMGGSPSGQPQAAPRSEHVDQRRGGSSGGGGQRNGGGGSGEHAVPRGAAGNGGSTSSSAGSRGGNERASGNNREDSGSARPRDGRQPVGTAVERRGPAPSHGGGVYYPGVIYDPYYSAYYDPFYYGSRYSSYWSPYGYGFGLGYFAYDPFLFGGSGYYSGAYGNGGYGYGGYDPYQGGGGYGGSSGSSGSGYRGVGSLRLKVKPSNAQVYVDGYFMGVVDSFDGSFQKLTIEEGAHKVEVRAEGYAPVQFEVMVIPGETITYKGELPKGH